MTVRIAALILLILSASGSRAEKIIQSDSFTQLGTPKYQTGFTHFDYTNPAAPKGGAVTLSAIGTFDNFNRAAMRGNPGIGTDMLYDRLFVSSDDETGSLYPLIATSARYPDNYRWVEITLNSQARFHDGSPITAEDVTFTFNMFMTQGVPQFRVNYKGVTAKTVSPRIVRFDLPSSDRDMILSLLSSSVYPQSFWKDHNLADPLSAPPPSSGPWRISAWKMGQSITYTRVKNYWAANLPVNKGRYNFDSIRYDYYLDDNVAFEAFKTGAFDYRSEGSTKKWATQYTGSNFANGHIVKAEQPNSVATDTRWLAFNIQKNQFTDRRVREAFSLLFDFEWMNKALFYNAYKRVDSYFQNTEYAARDYPDAKELAVLAPLKGQYPAEVLDKIYQPPKTEGSGYDREKLLQALDLLKQAGWALKNQRLVNLKSGQPFRFELLLPSGGSTSWVLPFQHNLARIGITMDLRQVDSSQYLARLRKRDFDMTPTRYLPFATPDTNLKIVWASAYINSTWNTPGVSSPLVDNLIEQIAQHQGDKNALLTLGRVLDRVLLWNNYMIPLWYTANDRYAYWNKFSMPDIRPTYAQGIDNWWFDVNKAARLSAQRRKGD
ncbi:extracellular solute-binding protein [Erwinia piriflorinigrans]|uniref:Putative ABC transport system, periplasmic component n=1 Tax=Erwinia piriflorinigrans CFBP 5888 TaxID=1161919 RepID=V5Z9Z3_9GAMM|nr:extracellular solute-binding protein [Erwinia piriflorinigrans]CCG87760.1 putative ABC transport system, periplasmic component [Erwinia piriflorinigrans CFBP 5888]